MTKRPETKRPHRAHKPAGEHHSRLRHPNAEKISHTQTRLEQIIPLTIVIALLTVGIAAIIGQNVPVVMQTVGVETVTPKPVSSVVPKLFKVGDTITRPGKYSLRVNGVRLDPVGADPYFPGTDYEFYVLSVTITNLDSQPLPVAPVVQTYLRDHSGTSFEMAPAPMDNPIEAGPLAPGDTRTGEISYSVLKTAKDVHFVFDLGKDDVPNATVKLSN